MTLADYRAWAATPSTGRPEVSVVIPTYNEEWRILPTIGAIATHVSSMGFEWELIIADDGSTDSTIELVQDLKLANLQLLIAEKNGGKGSAVRRGIQAATGNYILFADADQSTPIEQLDQLLEPVKAGTAELAIGSRAAAGAAVQNKSLSRKILSGGLKSLVRTLYPIDVEDTQCGFKLFSAEAAKTLFDLQLIDGFSFDLEILYLAHRCGYPVVEIPVDWIDAPGSTVDAGKVALDFLRDLALIRTNDLLGRYGRDFPRPIERSTPATTATTSTPETEGSVQWTSPSPTKQTSESSASPGDSTPTKSTDLLQPSID